MEQAPATYLLWTCAGTTPAEVAARDGSAPEQPAPPRRRRRRVLLDEEDRHNVDEAIRLHCEHYDLWLGALSVQEDHVQCVIRDPKANREKIAQRLKGISTRALRYYRPDKFIGRVWRPGARVEMLESEEAISDALHHVLECDDPATTPEPDEGV